jgi:hypothetical protein
LIVLSKLFYIYILPSLVLYLRYSSIFVTPSTFAYPPIGVTYPSRLYIFYTSSSFFILFILIFDNVNDIGNIGNISNIGIFSFVGIYFINILLVIVSLVRYKELFYFSRYS